MGKTNANLEMIKVAVKHLEPLLNELVFVGGATQPPVTNTFMDPHYPYLWPNS